MNIFSKKKKPPSETKPTINLVTTLALNKIYIVLSVRGKNKLIIIQTVEWLYIYNHFLFISMSIQTPCRSKSKIISAGKSVV